MAHRDYPTIGLHLTPESTDPPLVQDHLALFREYAELGRRRVGAGVTPLEYQRWLDLDQRLGARFRKETAAQADARRPTRLLVEFRTPEQFCDAYIHELTRGGVFVNTPFALDNGTELVLCVRIRSLQKTFELPGLVASNNVSQGFSTDLLGMGVHFQKLEPELRLALDALFASARRAAERA